MQDKPKTKMKAGDLVKLRGHPNLGIILGFKRGDFNKSLLAEVKFLTGRGHEIKMILDQGTFLLSQEGLEVIA
tara:strand:+ start:231 stop:449 length:219 start_codon:yes stop_codon:yes gene_type:complete